MKGCISDLKLYRTPTATSTCCIFRKDGHDAAHFNLLGRKLIQRILPWRSDTKTACEGKDHNQIPTPSRRPCCFLSDPGGGAIQAKRRIAKQAVMVTDRHETVQLQQQIDMFIRKYTGEDWLS